MAALIYILVFLVLAVSLGVDIFVILIFAAAVLLLISALICIFFIISSIMLIISKPCVGKLSAIRGNDKNSLESVFYTVDKQEYKNIFPCEVFLKKILYKKDETVKLRFCKRINRVFDLDAVLCTLIGLVLSGALFGVVFSVSAEIFEMIL